MKKIYRHGDLGFTSTEENISTLKKVGSNRFVLALGETTGHKHVISAERGTLDIYKDEKTNQIVLVIDGKSVITHEEHKPIEIPTGVYRMKNQQEYDYHMLAGRQVID